MNSNSRHRVVYEMARDKPTACPHHNYTHLSSAPFPPCSAWWHIHLSTERDFCFLYLSNVLRKTGWKLISHRHFLEGISPFSQRGTSGVGAMKFVPAHLSWPRLCSTSPHPTDTPACVLTDQHTQATADLEPGFPFSFSESSTGFSPVQKTVAEFRRSLI